MREERHAITSVLLCKTSVAGVALSKAIQTCKNLQAAFARSHGFRHGSCLTRKRKALCTQFMCKGRMSRGTTFIRLFPAISQPGNGGKSEPLTVWLTFSRPARKLPSTGAFSDRLSAGEPSSLSAPPMYSSSSQPVAWINSSLTVIILYPEGFVK